MAQKAKINETIIAETEKIQQKETEYIELVQKVKEMQEKEKDSKAQLAMIMEDISNNLCIQNETQVRTCQLRNKLSEVEQEVINMKNEYSLILQHISSTQKMHSDLINEMVATASNQQEVEKQVNKAKTSLYSTITPRKSIQDSTISSPTPLLKKTEGIDPK